jgi:hypothetical protein
LPDIKVPMLIVQGARDAGTPGGCDRSSSI